MSNVDKPFQYHPTSSPPTHTTLQPIPAFPKILTLDIGGRKLKLAPDILRSGSDFFRRLMSGRFPWEPEPDGSYWLDADADLFVHLVRFMRRPNVFPLFYDAAKGFDYDLYHRLQAEADYFQMDALCNWIKEKKYLGAISIKTYTPNIRSMTEISAQLRLANISEDLHFVPQTRKVYICPRAIPVHRDRQDLCGMACRKKQGDHPVEYEKEKYVEVPLLYLRVRITP
ncbi:hypothetical protein BDW02DRAFT_580790 [Decorospora gaudefroyi]|uniref:BTB domain-containing protein n=1 Tax=Decorospora gaudefroyi TaxID=184978 RepID=A0A6A5KAK6_9PLEO|nr:hypothetical protein BDW02DRAFT_580790 [Decorospora gaudefroyi]